MLVDVKVRGVSLVVGAFFKTVAGCSSHALPLFPPWRDMDRGKARDAKLCIFLKRNRMILFRVLQFQPHSHHKLFMSFS